MISTPSSNNEDFSKQGREFGAFNNSKIEKPRFEAQPDQIPPQNLEAEESVLGGIWSGCASKRGFSILELLKAPKSLPCFEKSPLFEEGVLIIYCFLDKDTYFGLFRQRCNY